MGGVQSAEHVWQYVSIHLCFFSQRPLSLPFPHIFFFFFCSKIFSLLFFCPLSLFSFLDSQRLLELKYSTRTSRNGRCPKCRTCNTVRFNSFFSTSSSFFALTFSRFVLLTFSHFSSLLLSLSLFFF